MTQGNSLFPTGNIYSSMLSKEGMDSRTNKIFRGTTFTFRDQTCLIKEYIFSMDGASLKKVYKHDVLKRCLGKRRAKFGVSNIESKNLFA